MIENARARATQCTREMPSDLTVVGLGTETTGIDGDAEVIEIAIIDIRGYVLLDTLIRPQGDIPAEATAIHGINAALRRRGRRPNCRQPADPGQGAQGLSDYERVRSGGDGRGGNQCSMTGIWSMSSIPTSRSAASPVLSVAEGYL
jgi:hypothetical protein